MSQHAKAGELRTYDVAIIGGGPAGSTCGAFLAKYRPGVRVGIFEREVFPRDHVGESQLPIITAILDELGVWDKVEAANFPVKIGATYRWGNTDDLWDFNFLRNGNFVDQPRPAKLEGQRLQTAFQVDRAVYDKILLDHARELGCEIFENCKVQSVEREGDRVLGLTLAGGGRVEAKHYVDATGHSGMLRRAMGVGVEEPSNLKNVAFWDYWQDAEWAVTLGVGGTRVQILSLGYGWIWFIPLSPTRTSIGFVCPADYLKKSGMKPEALYLQAVRDEPRVRALVQNARREDKFATTKDWSFVADRMTGENWMLAGESAGFADPILSAGLSLTHVSAREAAFTILEMDRGADKAWLRREYENRNRRKIHQHIRFADYWYSANARFSDLKEFTSEIAKDAGLDFDAEEAFRWLGTGGFIEEDMGTGGLALFSLRGVHQIARRLSQVPAESPISGFNGFVLDLAGAERLELAAYREGRVTRIPALQRGKKILPLDGMFGLLKRSLEQSPVTDIFLNHFAAELAKQGFRVTADIHGRVIQCLEAMVRDGWVKCKSLPSGTPLIVQIPADDGFYVTNRGAENP